MSLTPAPGQPWRSDRPTADSTALSLLESRVMVLQEALRFYADEANYERQKGQSSLGRKSWRNPKVLQDGGEIARQALNPQGKLQLETCAPVSKSV